MLDSTSHLSCLYLLIHIKGDVRLGDNQIAEMNINGAWTPICGHWFWDNNYGASLFCHKLGFPSGTISDRITLPSDGVRMGKCELGDVWPYCSSGSNDHSIGGSKCQSGDKAGITINCNSGN